MTTASQNLMAEFRYTEARLRAIKERQWKDRWGKDYVAAILANPREAPGISSGCVMRPRKMGFREFHVLSTNEAAAALLALHHPGCWEVWDQRIMYPTPRPHFLAGHRGMVGQRLKNFRGTLDVADRLGMLSKHPKLRLKIGEDPHKWPLCPVFYISDLVLFMRDEAGPYTLNWPIKDKLEDFKKRSHRKTKRPPSEEEDSQVSRTLLEEEYYKDAGIRTQQIPGRQIDREVYFNLRELFADDGYSPSINDEQRSEMIALLVEGVGQDIPGHVLARKAAREFHVVAREALAILRQSIWRREIRIDLFRPFRVDKPLHPERTDVFVQYADWFRR